MNKINVGIIGLGVGEKHIAGFNSHPECNVLAVCDFSDKKLNLIKAKYPDIQTTKSADDILNNPNLNIVSVASYDNYHYHQIIQAIDQGKHIFVEKPLCLFSDEAVSIRNKLTENPGIHLSSNLNLRTSPRFVRLKKAVLSGEMGKLFYIEADYLWGRVNKLINGWRKDMPYYSIVLGAAVHMIDLIIWVTGQKPVEVFGYGNCISTEETGFKFDDFATIIIKFDNRMIAKVSANSGCVHPHFHRIAAFGTEKTFFNDNNGGKFIISRDKNEETITVKDEYVAINKKSEIIRTFIDSIIDTGKEPIVSEEDVFSTMSVCFAAEKAIQQGRPEMVAYI